MTSRFGFMSIRWITAHDGAGFGVVESERELREFLRMPVEIIG
jgi:hypothetical protein